MSIVTSGPAATGGGHGSGGAGPRSGHRGSGRPSRSRGRDADRTAGRVRRSNALAAHLSLARAAVGAGGLLSVPGSLGVMVVEERGGSGAEACDGQQTRDGETNAHGVLPVWWSRQDSSTFTTTAIGR